MWDSKASHIPVRCGMSPLTKSKFGFAFSLQLTAQMDTDVASTEPTSLQSLVSTLASFRRSHLRLSSLS